MLHFKSLLFLLLLTLGVSQSLAAYDYSYLYGTMLPYEFTKTDTVVPWGEGLRPVYINYVARHGARFLSSEKKIVRLRTELERARDAGDLTEIGERFLTLVDSVSYISSGRWGALSEVGKKEERQLARQIESVAPVLVKNGHVKAISTYVPRVVMTMYEFCHQLSVLSDRTEIATSEGRQFDSLLRYFTTDSAYVRYLKDPVWKPAYDAYAAETLPAFPASSFFKNRKDLKTLQKLSLDAYGIVQSLPAAGIDMDFSEWFSVDDFFRCWKVSNLEHYYERSANSFSNLPAESASALLAEIISSTDKALAGESEENIFLRFGHAETLLPLFSLMRFPGCWLPEASPEEVGRTWIDSEITPLGANLLMVVLQDSEGIPYVALRLNGRWIATAGMKVIDWESLKAIWLSYLK